MENINKDAPPVTSTPLPQRKTPIRSMRDRLGFQPSNVKDRLDTRTESRPSEDSSVVTSPDHQMESSSKQEELFPTPPATLRGVVIQHSDIDRGPIQPEPEKNPQKDDDDALTGAGNPVQGCQTMEEAVGKDKDKTSKKKSKGKKTEGGKKKKEVLTEPLDNDEVSRRKSSPIGLTKIPISIMNGI